MATAPSPADTLSIYDRVASDFQRVRDLSLFEKPCLDELLDVTQRHGPSPQLLDLAPRLLDLGCGTGAPIATYLAEQGMAITGIDGSASMLELFTQTLPSAAAHHADMRALDLGQRFDAILAWDSFFHLCPKDQRAMFTVFQNHAAPNASLMFTTGPEAGESDSHVAGSPVYCASLDAQEYRDLLSAHQFVVLSYRPEDPACTGHTIWLARYEGESGT